MKARLLFSLVVVAFLGLTLSACEVFETVLMLTPQVKLTQPHDVTVPPSPQTVRTTPASALPLVTSSPRIPTGLPLITAARTLPPAIPTDLGGAWGEICAEAITGTARVTAFHFPLGSAAVLTQEEKATRWGWASHINGLSEILADSAEKVNTLICIKESSEHAFNYMGGAVEGRRRIWNIYLVKPESREFFFSTRLVGNNPPSFTTVAKGTTVVMGGDPISKLQDVLYSQFITLPPLTARDEANISSITFSPDGRYLLTASIESNVLTFHERMLSQFYSPVQFIPDKTWKPGTTGIAVAYTLDSQGLVVSDLLTSYTHLYYLEIHRSAASTSLKLIGSAPCFGVNCEVGPVLPGNIIRRGDCEWKLDARMNCTPRLSLPGGLLASSENGEWLALGAAFAPTLTPIPVRSPTPTLSKTPYTYRTSTSRLGSTKITPEPTSTRTSSPTSLPTNTRTPANTRTPIPDPVEITLWNSRQGVLDFRIPVPPAPKSTTRALNPPEVIFAPNGAYIAVKYYDQFEIWDLSKASRVAFLAGYGLIAFSPDGLTLAGASTRAGVDLFDMRSLQFKGVLQTEIGQVHRLAFSPDGKQLAVSSGPLVQVLDLK